MPVTDRDSTASNYTLTRAKRLSWETQMSIPQTAESLARSLHNTAEFIKDPFLVFKRAIFQTLLAPEVIKAAQYIMIVLTCVWNIVFFGTMIYTVFKICRICIFIIERISWCILGRIKRRKIKWFKNKTSATS